MESYPVISADEEARRRRRPWLGAILEALDVRLRLNQGVIEYTRGPTRHQQTFRAVHVMSASPR